MLTWTRKSDAWFGNGFRIHRESTHRWVLAENNPASDAALVVADPTPLAMANSLKACKFEAEALHKATQMARQRKMLMAILLGTGAFGVFGASYPVVLIGAAVVGGAAALELFMTWYEPVTGYVRDSIQ